LGRGLEKINIACLHGFQGLPSDWDMVESHFMVSALAHRFEWWSVDYLKNPVLNAEKSFPVWAENFNQKLKLRFTDGPRVLVGYSLGGRLALHAFNQSPDLYDALILISTHPGLTKEKQQFERRQNDKVWSKKFQEMPWDVLQKEWNDQPVFRDSLLEPTRKENDYDRKQLSLALTEWSLANQQDFRQLVAEHSSKILWITGEKDIKFLSLAMEMKKLAPGLQAQALPKASHRVLFDAPPALAAFMISFLTSKLIPN
jgi:2-succinyl-6-hydroxy-2,4-cyclohexadiene-1-carboxylate synthase